ncbi:MAG: ribonuclease HI family protein [candidate division NC10 bacterium]|jgi:ribonuclease HI|nr:ribonuclease HI family protein [candidate division NC10 bacterium]
MNPRRLADILEAMARTEALTGLSSELPDLPPATLRMALEEASHLLEQMASSGRSHKPATRSLILHIDGAARGNPGPAGIGVVLWDEAGAFREEHHAYIGEATNNVAEYEALLFGVRKAKELGYAAVKVFSDSELLVRQIRGEYRVKSPRLREFYDQVQNLLRSFDAFEIAHVGRGMNARADILANRAIDALLSDRNKGVASHQRRGTR